MIIRNTFIIFSLLFTFTKVDASLTMAFISILGEELGVEEYNNAKIRQACIKVHGEEWFKERIILERRFRWESVFLSNASFMEISCMRAADPEDFMDMKAVIDYMANRNDTIYIGVESGEFENIYTSPTALTRYIRQCTKFGFEYAVSKPVNCLCVGNTPNIDSPDLIIIESGIFNLGNYGVVGDLRRENLEKCKREGYMDLSSWHFDKDKVREEDINLYCDYIIASDKLILKTPPKRTIPIDVHYNYNPKENNIYIKWKYFKPS